MHSVLETGAEAKVRLPDERESEMVGSKSGELYRLIRVAWIFSMQQFEDRRSNIT